MSGGYWHSPRRLYFRPIDKGGARAAGATLIAVVFYFNIRVRADIEVFPSPSLNKIVESFRSPEPFFKRVLGKS